MKNLVVVLALGSLAAPLTASAFPLMKALETKFPARRVARAEVCANFAGSWKGTCSVNGQALPEEQHAKITQSGCELIQNDGDVTAVGGFNALSMMMPLTETQTVGVSIQTSSAWNADYSEVHQHFAGTVVEAKKRGIAFDGAAVLKMDGARLSYAGTIAGVAVTCSYDRE